MRAYLISPVYVEEQSACSATIPLGIAYLQAYADKILGGAVTVEIFAYPEEMFERAKEAPPDLVGISCFFWTRNLSVWIAAKVKQLYPSCYVLVGGPSVDTRIDTQWALFDEFKGNCDLQVPGEGEIPFVNIAKAFLDKGPDHLLNDPIDGVLFHRDGEIISGNNMRINKSTPLDELPSPILNGQLDRFMTPEFQPYFQTSRFCPYSCTFCASGKDVGKLRAFSVEVIKAELEYMARHYIDYPHITLYMSDENFGINKQDLKVAHVIRDIAEDVGWPKKLSFYLDKKFTDTTRGVAEALKDLSVIGYWAPFQSVNPDTLKAVKRKNPTDESVLEITSWAKPKGITVGADLIWGMPYETKRSFLDAIDYCYDRDILPILVNLKIFAGTVMARADELEKYELKIKYRMPTEFYCGKFLGDFVNEYEEVVVGSSTANFNDYLDIRKVSFTAYAALKLGYYEPVFRYLHTTGVKITDILDRMVDPKEPAAAAAAARLAFINDYTKAVTDELCDTAEEVRAKMEKLLHREDGMKVSPRINQEFSGRLIFQETWMREWLEVAFADKADDPAVFRELCAISASEWVDLDNLTETKTLTVSATTMRFLNSIGYFGPVQQVDVEDHDQFSIGYALSDSKRFEIENFLKFHKRDETFFDNAIFYLGAARTMIFDQRTILGENCSLVPEDGGEVFAHLQQSGHFLKSALNGCP